MCKPDPFLLEYFCTMLHYTDIVHVALFLQCYYITLHIVTIIALYIV